MKPFDTDGFLCVPQLLYPSFRFSNPFLSKMSSNSSNPVVLYINYDAKKTKFDRVAIYSRTDGKFTVYYKTECTKETCGETTPKVLIMESHHDVLDYVEDMMDLMMNDIDTNPAASIDVMIPCMPVVAVHPKNSAVKPILLRSIRSWAKHEDAKKD